MPLRGFYILTVNGFLKPRFTGIGIFFVSDPLLKITSNAEKKKKVS